MKRVFLFFLCVILTLTCFAGCGQTDPLVGTWELDISLMDAFVSNGMDFESQFGSFSSDSRLKGVRMTFQEDGTVVTTASVPEITASIESFVRDFFAYLEDGGLYDFFEASGIGREEIDTYMSMLDKSMEDFVADMKEDMEEELNVEKISKDLAKSFAGNGVEQNASGAYEAVSVYEVREEGVLLTADTKDGLNHGKAYKFKLSEDGTTLTLICDGVTTTFQRIAE